MCIFFFQAEDGIRDLVRSRGLGDVYKRQDIQRPVLGQRHPMHRRPELLCRRIIRLVPPQVRIVRLIACLLYTSDAADERSSVDLGGRRLIKKKI